MMNKTFLLIIIGLFFGFNSFAQTQTEMNAEAYKNYDLADKDLNKAYKKLISILNPEEKKLLIETQRDWIKFRDSHCKFEAQPFNMGSMQPLIRANCLEEKTRARTKDLKESYESRKF
jgi:uncharacterized protein YecT (DUF1311 family)